MNEAKIYTQQEVKDAFKLLGLNVGEYDKVDKAYKSLAKKYHPDLGGDPEMMKRLNNAKEAIDQGGAVNSLGKESSREFWDRVNKEYAEGNAALLANLDNKLRPHLEKYSFYFASQVEDSNFDFNYKTSSSKDGARLSAEWTSDDKSKYFTLSFWLNYSKPTGTALGSSQNKQFSALYDAYMFIDGKKFKIKQRRWEFKSFNAEDYSDASDIFPKDKIKKALSTGKDKPIKRADFMKFLEVKMGAKNNGDSSFMYIPLGGKWLEASHALCLHRTVIMRQGYWGISGLAGQVGTDKYKHYTTGSIHTIKKGLKYSSLPETRKTMEAMPEIVKKAEEAVKKGDGTVLQDYIDSIKESLYEDVAIPAKRIYDELYENKLNIEEGVMENVLTDVQKKQLAKDGVEVIEARLNKFGDTYIIGKIEDSYPFVVWFVDPKGFRHNGSYKKTQQEAENVLNKRVVTESLKGNKMKNNTLSEKYLSMFEEEAPEMEQEEVEQEVQEEEQVAAPEEEIKDEPVVEQDEMQDSPQKLQMALDKLSKKPTAVKVEVYPLLLDQLISQVKDLPQGLKILKDFGAYALPVAQKGEAPEAE